MKTIRVGARQLSMLIREAFGEDLVDAGDRVPKFEETEVALALGQHRQRLWQRTFGEEPALEYRTAGFVLIPNDLPPEDEIDAWIASVADSIGWRNTVLYVPTYDVVNTEQGPGVRVNLRATMMPQDRIIRGGAW